MKLILILIIVIVALAICSYIYIYNPREGFSDVPTTKVPATTTTTRALFSTIMPATSTTTTTTMFSTTQPPTTKPVDPKTLYDVTNYNLTYHTDPVDANNENVNGYGSGYMWVIKDGKLQSIPYTDNSGSNLYYEPGSYRFGPSSYVPNYEESIYLSKLTRTSTNMPYYPESRRLGFCEEYKNYPDKLEEMCRQMPPDSCGSTNCCTLLGGSRCTYGDANGPKIKAIYSDQLIANKDFYYYQGKCYGNCNQTP